MRRSKQVGFTLVELLVVITIIGTLMSLLLPAVQQARESARGLSCKNNLNQLAKALLMYEQNYGRFPGYVESIGNDPAKAEQQLRGSWVVSIFPFMEEQNAYDRWKDLHQWTAAHVAILDCPSDPPDLSDSPSLSYVVNAGRSPGDTGPPSQPQIQEHQANGMFFDRSCPPRQGQRGAPQPPDPRQQANTCTMLEMSARYLDSHDGSSKTVMVSENVHTLYYLYYDADIQQYDESIPDGPQYFGFLWSNNPSTIERINGDNDFVVSNMRSLIEDYSHSWPSSWHPGHVNVAYADGHVIQLEETIDQVVYRQIMTTKSKAKIDRTWDSLVSQ